MPRSPENFAEATATPAQPEKIHSKIEGLEKEREAVMSLFRKLGLDEQIDVAGALKALKEQNPGINPQDFLSVAQQMIEEREEKPASSASRRISNAPVMEEGMKIEPRRSLGLRPEEMFEELLEKQSIQEERKLRERWESGAHRSSRGTQKPRYKEVDRDTIEESLERARRAEQ